MKLESRLRISLLFSITAICLFHLLGYLFPEPFWASHYLAFLPNWMNVIAGLITLVAIGDIIVRKNSPLPLIPDEIERRVWMNSRVMFPLIAAAFANMTPIVFDTYGDAAFIGPDMNVQVTEWTQEMTEWAFEYNPFNPKIGSKTYYSLTHSLGWLFGIKSIIVGRYIELLYAFLFTLFWMGLVQHYCKPLPLRMAVSAIGILAPITLIFHAHYETYALIYTFVMGFLLLLKHYFNDPKVTRLGWLFLLFLVGLKLHILLWLLLPALILAAFHRMGDLHRVFQNRLTLRNMLVFMFLPGLVVVIITYLKVSGLNGTLVATEEDLYTAVFIPLFPQGAPPMNKYSLFGVAHLWDLLQLLFSWSPVLGFVMLLRVFLWKALFDYKDPFLISVLIVFLAFVLVLFIINPLLSMPNDWDLFCFPAPFFMVLALGSLALIVDDGISKKLIVPMLCLSLLNLPVFLVSASATPLSARLESMGLYSFKHYWFGTSSYFRFAQFLEVDSDQKLKRRLEVMENLEPYAVKGSDMEYAEIVRETGNLLSERGDLKQALQFHKLAEQYEPLLQKNVYDLASAYFMLGEPQKALPYLDRIVAFGYPSTRKGYMVALHISLAAMDYNGARKYCSEALRGFPDDPFFKEVLRRIGSNDPSTALGKFATR